MKKIIPAGRFKAECLHLMDEVMRTEQHIIITKRNTPIAELVPIQKKKDKKLSLAETLKDSVQIIGDIISPIDEEWNACS